MSTPLIHRVCTVRQMAPPSKIRVESLDAHPVESATWIRSASSDRAYPAAFTVVAVLTEPRCSVALEVRIEDAGLPVIHLVAVERIFEPGSGWGPAVGGTLLRRIGLDALMRQGLDRVGEPIVSVSVEGLTDAWQLQRDVDAGRIGEAWVTGRPVQPLAGRGRKTSDEVLRRVATVYREALASGSPPTRTVAEQLHVSQSHAGRLVARARVAGYLAPTVPGKAGG